MVLSYVSTENDHMSVFVLNIWMCANLEASQFFRCCKLGLPDLSLSLMMDVHQFSNLVSFFGRRGPRHFSMHLKLFERLYWIGVLIIYWTNRYAPKYSFCMILSILGDNTNLSCLQFMYTIFQELILFFNYPFTIIFPHIFSDHSNNCYCQSIMTVKLMILIFLILLYWVKLTVKTIYHFDGLD